MPKYVEVLTDELIELHRKVKLYDAAVASLSEELPRLEKVARDSVCGIVTDGQRYHGEAATVARCLRALGVEV